MVLIDREGLTGIDWGVYGVPETFIINNDGAIVYKNIGAIDENFYKNETEPFLLKAKPNKLKIKLKFYGKQYFENINSDTFQTAISGEERFQNLTNELRCLVCQNQTIAESNATLAVDLKRNAKQIAEGKSDQETFHYGRALCEFVLYNPPVSAENSLLKGPFIVLAIACLF